MNFGHSAHGESAKHLFFGTDFVVYTEGHPSSGKSPGSGDLIFWQRAFKRFLPARSCHFTPLGGKSSLTPIAKRVKADEVSNVIVYMDRDHDDVSGNMIMSDRVLYTFGYSWENDACHEKAAREVFFSICARCRIKDGWIGDQLEEYIAGFVRSLSWPVLAEVWLSGQGVFVFPRTKGGKPLNGKSLILSDPVPRADKSKLKVNVSEANARRDRGKPLATKRGHPHHDCWGHLLADYCTMILRYMLRTHCGITTVTDRVIMAQLISLFGDVTYSPKEVIGYYSAKMSILERSITENG